jgi:hypothetical protein
MACHRASRLNKLWDKVLVAAESEEALHWRCLIAVRNGESEADFGRHWDEYKRFREAHREALERWVRESVDSVRPDEPM